MYWNHRPASQYIYIYIYQNSSKNARTGHELRSNILALEKNETGNKGRDLFKILRRYLVCLSVIFVSQWRIRNTKPHVSCKPDGWIPTGVSRIYIMILRWVSLLTKLQITYLVFDIHVDFSKCTGKSRVRIWTSGCKGEAEMGKRHIRSG